MPMSELDRTRLREALALAEAAIGLSEPNPRVGCVIGRADGSVLGRGHTQEAGGPHAEVMALRDAASGGLDVVGATAWVTLEPCAHHGRTPPCCDALIAARIGRVVVAIGDPYPHVDGAGIGRMRAAGIDVEMADADIADAAHELNIGFFSRVQRGRPWVRMKIAASLDGRTALHDGSSQWITGEPARRDGHAWRRRAGAVLTGIGTVLQDDPRLDVRLVETPRQPMRVVVDSRLQLPVAARIVGSPGSVTVYTALHDAAREADLAGVGAQVRYCPGPGDKVDLAALLADLASMGINELHVEAGHKLNGSLVRTDLVDEWLLYMAPMWLGPGEGMLDLDPLAHLDHARRLRFVSIDAVGTDLRLRARPLPADQPVESPTSHKAANGPSQGR